MFDKAYKQNRVQGLRIPFRRSARNRLTAWKKKTGHDAVAVKRGNSLLIVYLEKLNYMEEE